MKSRYRWHILFWLAYLLFETYLEFAWISGSYQSIPVLYRFFRLAMLEEATMLLVKIPLSYLVIYLLNRVAGELKKPWQAAWLLLLALAVGVLLHRLLVVKVVLPYIYVEHKDVPTFFSLQRLISALLDLLFVLGFVVAIKQYRLYRNWRHREQELENQKLEAELKFLRTQTNPHFLFNTLNNIYALARKKADETPDVVMKLSQLLRFMLYESGKESITLAQEIKVLTDYIELERIRYNERLTIDIEQQIDNGNELIAPLVLLPFVENAFKHGPGESRFNSYIHIQVQLRKGVLVFTVENSKDEGAPPPAAEGIGLKNVRRQLELMYPKHELTIRNDLYFFIITLTINLHDYVPVPMHHSRR